MQGAPRKDWIVALFAMLYIQACAFAALCVHAVRSALLHLHLSAAHFCKVKVAIAKIHSPFLFLSDTPLVQ
jgi:hypothetical protein